MQIVINIEKRYLIFFALFLVALVGVFYVQAITTTVPNPGHGLDKLGPGLLELDNGANKVYIESTSDPVTEFVYKGTLDGNALDLTGNLLIKKTTSQPTATIILVNPPTVGGTPLCIDAAGKIGRC